MSESKRKQVVKYIKNQWKHHKNISYEDELKEFLDKHNIDYDEEYLWS